MDATAETVIKLLVTIVDRGRGRRAADLYRAENLHFDYICLGHGTANSEILDLLGLGETDKDVVIALAPHLTLPRLLRKARERLMLDVPGMGILFTVPLSGVSSQIPQVLCKPEYMTKESDVNKMENSAPHDLIITILNRGYTDQVMDAAKEAGARGGTVLHARRVGYEDAENFLGFTLQPEKEIIAILTRRESKRAIMQAINTAAGLTTECAGVLFSLPVDDILGLP